MPKRISIVTHLSVDELEQCYRQATQPIERSHYQIIWLLAFRATNRGSSRRNQLQPSLDL